MGNWTGARRERYCFFVAGNVYFDASPVPWSDNATCAAEPVSCGILICYAPHVVGPHAEDSINNSIWCQNFVSVAQWGYDGECPGMPTNIVLQTHPPPPPVAPPPPAPPPRAASSRAASPSASAAEVAATESAAPEAMPGEAAATD